MDGEHIVLCNVQEDDGEPAYFCDECAYAAVECGQAKCMCKGCKGEDGGEGECVQKSSPFSMGVE